MVEVQPGLRVRSPRMLHFQQQTTQQGHVGRIPNRKPSLGQPRSAQAADLSVSCDLERVAGDAMYPRIANFFSNHRQFVAIWLYSVRNLSQAGRGDLGS